MTYQTRQDKSSEKPHNGPIGSLKDHPNAIEAEKAVLGGIIINNDNLDKIVDVINIHDFFEKDHQAIFDAMLQLDKDGHPFDVVTLSEFLLKQSKKNKRCDIEYLTGLSHNITSFANLTAYAKLIKDKSILRHLLKALSNISNSVYNDQGFSSNEILDKAENSILAISENSVRQTTAPESVASITPGVIKTIDGMRNSKGGISGVDRKSVV